MKTKSGKKTLHKARLRAEAKARNEAWQELTPEQQIASLKMRRGESNKQIARIEGAIKAKGE